MLAPVRGRERQERDPEARKVEREAHGAARHVDHVLRLEHHRLHRLAGAPRVAWRTASPGCPATPRRVKASPCVSSTRVCVTTAFAPNAGGTDTFERDRRWFCVHEVVVIVPDQDLDPVAVDGGERVDVGLLSDAVRQDVAERPRAAARDREPIAAQAAEQLERVQHGQVDAVRRERAIAGEVGRVGEGERPGQHAAQVDTHLGRELERALHHRHLVGAVGGRVAIGVLGRRAHGQAAQPSGSASLMTIGVRANIADAATALKPARCTRS